MNTVHVKINGIEVEVPSDYTVLMAAEKAGVHIPTLCYLKDVNAIGACRMCVVEVKGARSNPVACLQQVAEGMEVQTNTPTLRASRKMTLELMLSNHRMDCLGCVRSTNCELQTLAQEYGADPDKFRPAEPMQPDLDESAIHLIRDNSKCILCRRCIAVCKNVQHAHVIGASMRGFKTHVSSPFEMPLADTSCVNCGQCIQF